MTAPPPAAQAAAAPRPNVVLRLLRPVHRRARRLAWYVRWGRRPYVEYHRHFMDARAARDPKSAVGGLWESIGRLQLDFLRGRGLQPRHTLLDIGCGSLRGGLHFIRYLEPGHYWGLEVSPRVLEAGRRFLEEAGLADRNPHLLLTQGFGFQEVAEQHFDFVHAFGVFTDMPAGPVEACFASLHRVMSPATEFYATFVPGQRYVADPVRVDFRYPLSFFQHVGARYGYRVELVDGFVHPRGHAMLRVQRRT